MIRPFNAAVFLLVAGCVTTPESYISKLHVGTPNVNVNREGAVEFAVEIQNNGDKALANVPMEVTCQVTSKGSVPRSATLETGPLAEGESATLRTTLGPYQTGLYMAPHCTYTISTVAFAE